MKFNKIVIAIVLMLCIININNVCSAKYVFEYVKIASYLEIDRTAPVLEIEYSNKEITNTEVQVKITANEKIQNIAGWTLLEDGKTLTKIYNQNIKETIIVTDLSGNKTETNIEINNIDKNPPVAEIVEINNTNIGYENYANKSHQITVKIKISDNNKIVKKTENFAILVDTKEGEHTKEINVIEEKENYIIYEIKLSNISENGQLKIQIPQNSFEDIAGNILNEIMLDTGILIDNIAPTIQFEQVLQGNGKVLAKITSDEQIRNMNGWQTDSSNKISSKEFISDIKYHRPIMDFAGNIQNVEINIQNSTFLDLEVKAHMSRSAFADSEIAKNVVGRMEKGNIKYKFESLLFRTSQNVDKDFLKVAGYVYSYWGENSYAKSGGFGMIYNYGYNPIEGYKTMENTELVQYENKDYIHLGGEGINHHDATDLYGNNPIPAEIASQYRYGITGIKLDLGDNDYSIIYQIFFDDTGWLETHKNGEVAMRDETLPIEAMRIAVVPTSELDFATAEWDKCIGTYNLE